MVSKEKAFWLYSMICFVILHSYKLYLLWSCYVSQIVPHIIMAIKCQRKELIYFYSMSFVIILISDNYYEAVEQVKLYLILLKKLKEKFFFSFYFYFVILLVSYNKHFKLNFVYFTFYCHFYFFYNFKILTLDWQVIIYDHKNCRTFLP